MRSTLPKRNARGAAKHSSKTNFIFGNGIARKFVFASRAKNNESRKCYGSVPVVYNGWKSNHSRPNKWKKKIADGVRNASMKAPKKDNVMHRKDASNLKQNGLSDQWNGTPQMNACVAIVRMGRKVVNGDIILVCNAGIRNPKTIFKK